MESRLSTGMHFINTALSEEERATSRDIQPGATGADLRRTTQRHPLFVDTDRCGEAMKTRVRTDHIRVSAGVTWAGDGLPRLCLQCFPALNNLQHVYKTLTSA